MQASSGISSRDAAPQDGHVIVAILISRLTGYVRLTPSGKLRARPASAQQSCDNPSMHCTAALPARQLHLLVMPMQKENASRADEAYSCNELNLPRSYCRRPPRSPHHPPTNVTARATKPDAIQ